jgi:acylphosphatase
VEDNREQHEVFYSGRVQGVGFRYTVRSLAVGLHVTGYVRNLSDGRVHLVVEGDAGEVNSFLDAIKKEMAYYVGSVQHRKRPATGGFRSFEIRH